MPVSRINIFNGALARVGTGQISNPDGTEPGAVICRVFYNSILEEMLRSFDFNFAGRRVVLALSDETPVGYDYAYTKPDNCLRVRHLLDEDGENADADYPWIVRGDQILTDLEDACVEYTRNNVTPEEFDSTFRTAFETRLGAEIAPAIKPQDMKKQTQLWQLYNVLWGTAKYANATENNVNPEPVNQFLNARRRTETEDEE